MAKTRSGPVRAGTAADLVLGSWRRTLIVAAALLALFVAVVVGALNFTNLQHASFPGHPYPPAGYYRNPFPGSDELVNSADAARVKADLMDDGWIELQALEQGDANALAGADAGNRLDRLRQLIDANNKSGVVEHEDVRLQAITVGHLPDPNDPIGTVWCVEERGTGTITYLSKATRQPLRSQSVTFDNRFWLRRVNRRYLIADAEIHSNQGG